MKFDELKIKLENTGFKFEWCDEDVEGTEVDEDTGKEREVSLCARGWWVKHPPDYNYPRIFVPADDTHPEAYLNVMLERYEKRHDRDEEEAKMMKHFEETFKKTGGVQ